MARPTVKEDAKTVISTLRKAGGSAGNLALRRELGWRDARYWAARDLLIESGKAEKGLGRGGSVRLAGR
jgi:Arc/MetJ family transcription regulator